MTIDEVEQKINKMAFKHEGQFGGKANFAFEEGTIHLDDTQTPVLVTREARDAPFTIRMKADTFGNILSGDTNVMMALMSGKVKIEGDKSAALKLTSLF